MPAARPARATSSMAYRCCCSRRRHRRAPMQGSAAAAAHPNHLYVHPRDPTLLHGEPNNQ